MTTVDIGLLVLGAAWVVVVGCALVRVALAARRLGRTTEATSAARLEALLELDRRRAVLGERRASTASSVRMARETATGARRGLRVLGVLGDAVREAAGRR